MSANRKVFMKIVIIGDSGVGKTSLLQQYVQGKVGSMTKPTIGADFSKKTVVVDNTEVTCQIWDTAGQERFQSLGYAFYRGADCCALVYDITQQKTFDNLGKWKQGFIDNASPTDANKFPFVVIGNKVDKESERKVQENDAKQWCEENGRMSLYETSATGAVQVENAFIAMIKAALISSKDNKMMLTDNILDPSKHTLKLGLDKKEQKPKQKACEC